MGGFLNLYKDVGKAFRTFFSSVGIFKVFLPLDIVFIIVGVAIPFITGFLGMLFGIFGGGTILGALSIYFFVLGIFLAMANGHASFVFIGLFGLAGVNLILFLKVLIKFGGFSWAYIIPAAIIGGIGLLVMQYCSGVTAED